MWGGSHADYRLQNNVNVSARIGVRGIPAMYLFRNGSVLAQTAGAMNADGIARWTRSHLALS